MSQQAKSLNTIDKDWISKAARHRAAHPWSDTNNAFQCCTCISEIFLLMIGMANAGEMGEMTAEAACEVALDLFA